MRAKEHSQYGPDSALNSNIQTRPIQLKYSKAGGCSWWFPTQEQ